MYFLTPLQSIGWNIIKMKKNQFIPVSEQIGLEKKYFYSSRKYWGFEV